MQAVAHERAQDPVSRTVSAKTTRHSNRPAHTEPKDNRRTKSLSTLYEITTADPNITSTKGLDSNLQTLTPKNDNTLLPHRSENLRQGQNTLKYSTVTVKRIYLPTHPTQTKFQILSMKTGFQMAPEQYRFTPGILHPFPFLSTFVASGYHLGGTPA